jgi:hypothetical protein
MIPVWVGYLAFVGLLLCLALETWQTALASLVEAALSTSHGPGKPDLLEGEAERAREESRQVAEDGLDGAVEAASYLLRLPRAE